jgi:hypothetical protein
MKCAEEPQNVPQSCPFRAESAEMIEKDALDLLYRSAIEARLLLAWGGQPWL